MRHSSSKPPPPIPTESGDAHHNHHQWHTGGPLSHFFFFYTYNPQFSFPGRKNRTEWDFFPGWEKTTTLLFLKPDLLFYFSSLRGG